MFQEEHGRRTGSDARTQIPATARSIAFTQRRRDLTPCRVGAKLIAQSHPNYVAQVSVAGRDRMQQTQQRPHVGVCWMPREGVGRGTLNEWVGIFQCMYDESQLRCRQRLSLGKNTLGVSADRSVHVLGRDGQRLVIQRSASVQRPERMNLLYRLRRSSAARAAGIASPPRSTS